MTKIYNDPLYHVDYNAIICGMRGDGVKSGLDVTERGAGQNMSVDIAAGTAIIDFNKYTESSTVNLSISAAHATLPRRDIVIYDTFITNPKVIIGTPATEPIPPDITADDILLAVVNIAAGVSVITNNDIDDGRINVPTEQQFETPSSVLASKVLNTVYHNNSNKPLFVVISSHTLNAMGSHYIKVYIDTDSGMASPITLVNQLCTEYEPNYDKVISVIIPPYYYYKIYCDRPTYHQIRSWCEIQ